MYEVDTCEMRAYNIHASAPLIYGHDHTAALVSAHCDCHNSILGCDSEVSDTELRSGKEVYTHMLDCVLVIGLEIHIYILDCVLFITRIGLHFHKS